MAESSDLEPLQWLERLGTKLIDRRARIDYWRRYYDGEQDLPAGPSQHRDAYRRFQATARTNLCRLCVESMVPRLQITGYRDGSGPSQQNTNPVWKLWQAAKMDSRQYGVWRKAISRSVAYVIVGVDPRRPNVPRITIEGPESVIVECDPADPYRRLAALRLWRDTIAGRWMATIYLPGVRHHWQTKAGLPTNITPAGLVTGLSFKPDAWEERAEPGRSLPDVPVVPFYNGDPGEEPEAEFAVGIDVQNRLNLTLLNRLTAERYGAFRQRYLTNYEPVIDEVSGLPIAPFNPGADQVITIPPPEPGQPESKIGDLQQTDTSAMLRAVEADMRAFAAVTVTPVYYLPGDLVNIGADSIMALDAGHVAKIRQRMGYWGEDMEEVLSLMASVAGIDQDLSSSEVVWARPENFNPAAVADYATKLKAAGVPLPMIVEEIGWSPQRVAELRAAMAADTFLSSLSTPRPPVAGGDGATAPVAGAQRPAPAPAVQRPVNVPPANGR